MLDFQVGDENTTCKKLISFKTNNEITDDESFLAQIQQTMWSVLKSKAKGPFLFLISIYRCQTSNDVFMKIA